MRRQTAIISALAVLISALACRTTPMVLPTPTALPTQAPLPTLTALPTHFREVARGAEFDLSANSAFTRCVTAEVAVWLRSKPWPSAPLAIPNALANGTHLQVYTTPQGVSNRQWIEVWVLEQSVGGYVNSDYIGSCK